MVLPFFNVNKNMDIAHYKPDGSVVYYKNLGGLETNYTTDGEKYQIIYILNDEGEEIHTKSQQAYECIFRLEQDNTLRTHRWR